MSSSSLLSQQAGPSSRRGSGHSHAKRAEGPEGAEGRHGDRDGDLSQTQGNGNGHGSGIGKGEGSGNGNGNGRKKRKREFVYDPMQDVAEKRELRKEYRALIASAEDARGHLAENSAANLEMMIRQADALWSKVKAPTEGVLDSKFLLNMSDIGAQMARNLKLDANAFDIDEYVARVARFMGGTLRAPGRLEDDDDGEEPEREWNWDRLGRAAAKFSRRAPTMDFLLGPLEVEQKKRKAGKRQRFEKNKEDEVAPQELNEEDIQRSENETTQLVREIADLLEEVGGLTGVNMFKFVINPESFSNTIENLFYVSFLVRDGRVSLDDDEDGEPILLRCEPPDEEDYKAGVTRRQIVMEFDMQTWKDLIETYQITEAIIPSRKTLTTNATRNGKWYG